MSELEIVLAEIRGIRSELGTSIRACRKEYSGMVASANRRIGVLEQHKAKIMGVIAGASFASGLIGSIVTFIVNTFLAKQPI